MTLSSNEGWNVEKSDMNAGPSDEFDWRRTSHSALDVERRGEQSVLTFDELSLIKALDRSKLHILTVELI